jgi:hypothetical protein
MRRRVLIGFGVGFFTVVLLATEPWRAAMNVDVSEPAPAGATVMRIGPLVALEHESSGTAQIVEQPDGKRWLRLAPFQTSLGPDVVVMLSPKRVDGWFGYDEGALKLEPMKGNRGEQNYALPDGVDLSRYESAVIWCQRFHIGFAAATLEPVKAAVRCDLSARRLCGG